MVNLISSSEKQNNYTQRETISCYSKKKIVGFDLHASYPNIKYSMIIKESFTPVNNKKGSYGKNSIKKTSINLLGFQPFSFRDE